MQLRVRDRDEVVRPEEDVDLGRVQALDRLVVTRKVQDREQVLRVVVDLRALPARQDVLEIERMPAESLGQLREGVAIERLEMDPGEAARAELSDSRFRARAPVDLGRPRPRSPDAGQAGHRY